MMYFYNFSLAATNGEITITKSHGPSPSIGSSSSSSSHPGTQLVPQIKLSPSSMHLSPTGSDGSGADLLDDSPSKFEIISARIIRIFFLFSLKKSHSTTPFNSILMSV